MSYGGTIGNIFLLFAIFRAGLDTLSADFSSNSKSDRLVKKKYFAENILISFSILTT